MLSDFINSFKSSSAYKLLFDGQRVAMIYIAGSRLSGAIDERSDYDIIVVVDNEGNYAPEQTWSYEGKKVHWYFVELPVLAETRHIESRQKTLFYTGYVLFGLLKDENIIYENPDYRNAIDALKANKRNIGINGARLMYDWHKDYIDSIIADNSIQEVHYSKFIAHFCTASFFVWNEPIDTDLIREIKRIRWQPVSDECKTKAVERLRLLKKYFDAE